MARLVTVHGIGQQLEGPETYDWVKPLRSGMLLAGREPIAADDVDPGASIMLDAPIHAIILDERSTAFVATATGLAAIELAVV
jgi:hypothetical protein